MSEIDQFRDWHIGADMSQELHARLLLCRDFLDGFSSQDLVKLMNDRICYSNARHEIGTAIKMTDWHHDTTPDYRAIGEGRVALEPIDVEADE